MPLYQPFYFSPHGSKFSLRKYNPLHQIKALCARSPIASFNIGKDATNKMFMLNPARQIKALCSRDPTASFKIGKDAKNIIYVRNPAHQIKALCARNPTAPFKIGKDANKKMVKKKNLGW